MDAHARERLESGPPLRAPRTGIGIQRQDQDVAGRAGLLQEPDVAGVKQVIAAIGEDYGFAVPLPALALFEKFRAAVELGHRFQCSSRCAT